MSELSSLGKDFPIDAKSEKIKEYKATISLLKEELSKIESKVDVFAQQIRNRFENEIIEEQELVTLQTFDVDVAYNAYYFHENLKYPKRIFPLS